MDLRFLEAVAAIKQADTLAFEAILEARPGLATDRSSCSHPTLLQCLVLDGAEHAVEVQQTMARSLLDRGAPIDEPLIAAASVGNLVLGRLLLDEGAALDGSPAVIQGWTPLEESLYWGFPAMTELLLERGARVANLRSAAGLGRVEEMKRFFDEAGELRTDCGGINSPFGGPGGVEPRELVQHLLDNALAYAAMGGHLEAATLLLERGGDVGSFPLGFHFRGTALHWAAVRGHTAMCDLLLARGADPRSTDLKIQKTPAEWAAHGGHQELAQRLEARGQAPADSPTSS